jgi:septum formation protein
MKELGVKFTHKNPTMEEDYTITDPVGRVEENARRKATSVDVHNTFVVGSDTVVVYDGEIYGKPLDLDDARRTLNIFSGKRVQVYSGVSIRYNNKILTRYAVSCVLFRNLSKADIDGYVYSGEPMGKAGSFGVQGLGGSLVKKIEGSYSNVVGLPIELLKEMLNEFSVEI